MGIEPYLLTSSITAVLAQRLLRKICPYCREVYVPTEFERGLLKEYSKNGERMLYKGKGCENCINTGYTGRVGIFELLVVSNKIRQMVQDKMSSEEIKAEAAREGMTTLREDGMNKVFEGVTTLSEVVRVTIE
jgi:type II secretory ATPase GspE/PulE/Tfp pilus assembly ATPase PilB-like protein